MFSLGQGPSRSSVSAYLMRNLWLWTNSKQIKIVPQRRGLQTEMFPSPISYVKALILDLMAFGGGAFARSLGLDPVMRLRSS